MANDKHYFTSLFIIHISSLVKSLLKYFAHLLFIIKLQVI